MKYICIVNGGNICGTGDTLIAAFEDLQSYDSDYDIDDVSFYEVGRELAVEVKIVEKEVPVEVSAKGRLPK